MYEYIKGVITEIYPSYVVLEANNVGYLIYMPNPYSVQINETYRQNSALCDIDDSNEIIIKISIPLSKYDCYATYDSSYSLNEIREKVLNSRELESLIKSFFCEKKSDSFSILSPQMNFLPVTTSCHNIISHLSVKINIYFIV